MARTIAVYKSYNFVDKDPVLDKLRTVISDASVSYAEIERRSGVCQSTLNNWFGGKTKRPQFATVAAVARCLGKDVVFVDMKK